MFQSIFTLVIFVQILQVHSRLTLQQSAEAKLVIYPQQQFLNAFTGKPLVLECRGIAKDGDTFTDFSWLNPQREVIAEGSPGVKELDKNTLQLSFVDPTVEDSGVYKCTATYENSDYLEEEISISFREDIKFENCSEYQILFNNEEGEIRCQPVSKQQLSITWTKDNKKLEIGRFIFVPSGIVINNVKNEDAGVYSIEAFEPTTGTLRQRNIEVDVQDKEEENATGIIQRVSVLNVTKDTVYFNFQLSGYVKNIEVKYREILEETDRNITWKLGNIYAVRNLIPSGQYTFHFRPKPSQLTTWSKTVKVTLLSAAPEIVLRQLNDEVLEIEWIRTVEDRKRNTIDRYQLSYQPVHEMQGSWKRSNCNVTIEIPTSCFKSVYKVADFSRETMYEIRVKAHTSAGFGDDYIQKVQIV